MDDELLKVCDFCLKSEVEGVKIYPLEDEDEEGLMWCEECRENFPGGTITAETIILEE